MSQWRPVGGEIRPGVSLREQPGKGTARRRRGGAAGPRKPGWRGPFGLSKWQTVAAVIGALFLALVLFITVVALTLPDPANVQLHAGEIKIYDHTGQKLVADVQGGGQQRTEVGLDRISKKLQDATVAAEDKNFRQHAGIDWGRLARALTLDIINRRADSGASTITQQLAKNELLTADRTPMRKIREAILATEIEQRFTKDEILKLYLNSIFYGHHSYGAQAAAKTYFDKDAADLSLGQASFLAGLPQAPSYYDPQTNYEGAKARQHYVLDQMVRDGMISQQEADAADAEDLVPQLKYKIDAVEGPAPHFVQYLLGQLESQYGADLIRVGGIQVTSTLDLDVQAAAGAAVKGGVEKLAGQGVNNGAMLVTDPRTGQILAMVGSYDYTDPDNKIAGQNNMTLRPRQPGSSFKPYVYLTGIANKKFDTVTPFDDSGNVFGKDTPKDFDNRYEGKMLLRQALVQSRNVPAEQAMQRAGIQDVLSTVRRMGITSDLKPELGTAIGSSEISMLEHATGYGVLASQGIKREPFGALKVLSGEGKDITIAPSGGQRVMDAAPTYIVNDILKGYNKQWNMGFDRTLASKSGTTNVGSGTGDGWLMSYNPEVVIAAWAGHTSPDKTVTAATRSFFGVNLAQAMVVPFLKSLPGRWNKDFDKPPDGLTTCASNVGGLNVQDNVNPEIVLSGDSCKPAETTPSPSTSAEPSPSPTIVLSPSPTPSIGFVVTPSPSGLLISPTPQP
jgi:penicillin-binding protein 1A